MSFVTSIDKKLSLNVWPVEMGNQTAVAEYQQMIRDAWIKQHGQKPPKGSVSLSIKTHREVPDSVSRSRQDSLIYNGHHAAPSISELHTPIVWSLQGIAFESIYSIEELHSEKLWVRPGNSLVEITVTELYERRRRIARKPIARAKTGGN